MAEREKYTEHPSIAVVGGKPHLRVFEDFFIEKQLPKWRMIKAKKDANSLKKEEYSGMMDASGAVDDQRSSVRLLDGADMDRRHYVNEPQDMISIKAATKRPPSVWERLFGWMRRPEKQPEGDPVEQVFGEMKGSFLTPTTKDLIYAKKALDAAHARLTATGQYEIAKKVESARPVLDAEVALVRKGKLKYISEEQCIQFMLKSERGVRLEYLRYWPDILPTEVAKAKLAADALCVFDNYCVLYYDPGTKKFSLIKEAMNEEERRKRRDPILFGVMHGSRKLYYVTDWVTKDDDLTLETLEKVLGSKAMDVSKDSFAETTKSVARMLDEVFVSVEQNVAEAEMNGQLLNDEMLELGYVDFADAAGDPQPEAKS